MRERFGGGTELQTIHNHSADAFVERLNQCSLDLLQAQSVAEIAGALERALVPSVASRTRVLCPAPRPHETQRRATMSVDLVAPSGLLGLLEITRDPAIPTTSHEDTFIRAVAYRGALALGNALRRANDRVAADAFQNAALASELPRIDGLRFDAYYAAGRSEALVGGDWFDAFRLDDGRLVLTIGDVMGSGVKAAVQMMTVRQTIRAVASVSADPAVILSAAAHNLDAQFETPYVTAFVGLFDPMTEQFSYANAGHPPPLVRSSAGLLRELPATCLPLGVESPKLVRTVEHVTLERGSSLILYTDGLVETTRNIVDGIERLQRLVQQAGQTISASALAHDAALSRSRDDVALLIMNYDAEVPLRRWRLDPAWSDAAARVRAEIVEAFIALTQGDTPRCLDLELILAETFSNLIRHAPGTAELILELNAQVPVLHVLDKGPGLQFSPHLPADLFSENGRGVFLIVNIAKSFSVERRPGGGSHARITL